MSDENIESIILDASERFSVSAQPTLTEWDSLAADAGSLQTLREIVDSISSNGKPVTNVAGLVRWKLKQPSDSAGFAPRAKATAEYVPLWPSVYLPTFVEKSIQHVDTTAEILGQLQLVCAPDFVIEGDVVHLLIDATILKEYAATGHRASPWLRLLSCAFLSTGVCAITTAWRQLWPHLFPEFGFRHGMTALLSEGGTDDRMAV